MADSIELQLGVELPAHVFDLIRHQLHEFRSELVAGGTTGEPVPRLNTCIPKVLPVGDTLVVTVIASFGDDKYELELVVPQNPKNEVETDQSSTVEPPAEGIDPESSDHHAEKDPEQKDVSSGLPFETSVPHSDYSFGPQDEVSCDESDNEEINTDHGSEPSKKPDKKRNSPKTMSLDLSSDVDIKSNEKVSSVNGTGKRRGRKRKAQYLNDAVEKTMTSSRKSDSEPKYFEDSAIGDSLEDVSKDCTVVDDDTGAKMNISDKNKPKPSKKKAKHTKKKSTKKKLNKQENKSDLSSDSVEYSVTLKKRKSRKSDSEEQKNKKESPKFKCSYCKVLPFSSEKALESHIARHNFQTMPKDNGKYECNECKKQFKTRANLTTHLWVHKERRFQCEQCDRKFVQKVQLQVHVRTIHEKLKPFLCGFCGKSFSGDSGLAYHMNSHKTEAAREKVAKEQNIEKPADCFVKNMVYCTECNDGFANVIRWLYHLKKHLATDDLSDASRESFEKSLKEHESLLHTTRVYKCAKCDHISFNSSENTLHKAVHVDDISIQCPQCDLTFSRESNLKYHVRRTHQRLHCQMCDARYGTQQELNEHQMNKHKVDPRLFMNMHKCYMCTYETKQNSRLLFHMDKVHGLDNPNGKCFQCGLCEKSFASKYSLQLHSRIHTNERPFKCPVCQKAYSDPSNLIHHGLKAHPEFPKETFHRKNQKFTVKQTINPEVIH